MLTIILALVGCAAVPLASQQADRQAKSFAVRPGLANIYIYRTESVGAALEIPVMIDGVFLGKTAEDTFVVLEVHPGRHTILSRAEQDTTLVVTAAPGQNVFVWQEVVPGLRRARTLLHLVDEREGMRQIKNSHLIERQ